MSYVIVFCSDVVAVGAPDDHCGSCHDEMEDGYNQGVGPLGDGYEFQVCCKINEWVRENKKIEEVVTMARDRKTKGETMSDLINSLHNNSAYDFKQYKRKGLSEMRPYIKGEDLSAISVSAVDDPENDMGMVARNPLNHADQWYVARSYFNDNLEPA